MMPASKGSAQWDVLVTCPPMLGIVSELSAGFASHGMRVTAPRVVQTLSEEELTDLLPRFDGWILGDDPATRQVLGAGVRGRLRGVVKWGVGVDNIDFDAATAMRLPVANTPGMFGDEVADVAMAYVTGLARETYSVDRQIRAGAWPKPMGVSLRDKVVGLVGLGQIGRCIARRLQTAQMHVIAYDPMVTAAVDGISVQEWPNGIEIMDFLVLACALTTTNVHMIDREVLARSKRGLRLVNVARGRLIDEEALNDALVAEQVYSAALDVFETEPLPTDSPLRRHGRCVFGSHNSSNTAEAVRRTSERAIELLVGFLTRTAE